MVDNGDKRLLRIGHFQSEISMRNYILCSILIILTLRRRVTTVKMEAINCRGEGGEIGEASYEESDRGR